MYKRKKFRIRKIEDIKEDITSARIFYGENVRSIFFADGNSIFMKTPQMVDILEFCYAMFPNLARVTCYGSAKFVLRSKTVDELKLLRRAGLKRLHMGLESGDDNVLESMNKGATADQMVQASRMVKDAGIELSQYVLLGLGGNKGWDRHAVNTSKVLNKMNPDFIRVRTLVVKDEAPLAGDVEAGKFEPCTPDQILDETRILIENLDVTSTFTSDHVSNLANVNGKLPEDKETMLNELEMTKHRLDTDPEFRDWVSDPLRCTNL
jgi:coproporphyrinogen III oxidase-like Fe-S oxidoreductase